MKVRSVLPRDAIPSIDDPEFGPDYFGASDDEVIVVESDPPRAYQIRILSYHEIVNDDVDGRPIAVTWCPICWSAVVYDSSVDGRPLTFGVSGKLADDALVMYDRETESEWKQPTGTAIAGELEGSRLTALPSPIVTWERFTSEYPEGMVLQPVRGTAGATDPSLRRIYDMERYEQYVERDTFGLYGMRGEGDRRSWGRDDLDAKSVVLGIEHDSVATGFPKPWVDSDGGLVVDSVEDLDVVVFTSDDGIYAFENPGHEFEHVGDEIRADGTTWDPVTGESEDGRALNRVVARRQFAFAWQDAHGSDAFYR